MRKIYSFCCIIALVVGIMISGTGESFVQAPSNQQVVPSGFGENSSTGSPRLQVIGDMLCASGHPFAIKWGICHI